MQINRYINGEKAKGFAGLIIENEAVKEAVAEAARRVREEEERE